MTPRETLTRLAVTLAHALAAHLYQIDVRRDFLVNCDAPT
jgi:hypothetical protein